MAENINSLVGSTLLCHYGETHDAFLIGYLVQSGETLTTTSIRHCRHLVNFRIEQNDSLYIAKELDGFMDHEPIKITILISDFFVTSLIGGLVTMLPHCLLPLLTLLIKLY
jgi:hypothetical protein